MTAGSLIVVGTGIRLMTQLTPESRVAIEQADRVLYVATGPVMDRWLTQLHPRAESLRALYQPGAPRRDTYAQIVEAVLAAVRGGSRVCFVVYGHPGVVVHAAHEAIRRARGEGFRAEMLPGISSEGCLFADLGVDPGDAGYQSFDATDFLVQRRRFDPRSALLLYQIAAIGLSRHTLDMPNVRGLEVLAARLAEDYPPDHPAIVYTAAELPACQPTIARTTVAGLPGAEVPIASSLFVPPLAQDPLDPEILASLAPR